MRTASYGLAALLALLLVPLQAIAQERGQLAVQPHASPRDDFVGRWMRYGDTFFPDDILFEIDPASPDRLLVSFTLHCQYQAPGCSAVRARSEPAFFAGDTAMVYVNWLKDAAGNTYNVSFQRIPDPAKMTQGPGKEINAIFTITMPSNRQARFAGTMPNELRYAMMLAPASIPHTTPAPGQVQKPHSLIAPFLRERKP